MKGSMHEMATAVQEIATSAKSAIASNSMSDNSNVSSASASSFMSPSAMQGSSSSASAASQPAAGSSDDVYKLDAKIPVVLAHLTRIITSKQY